MPSTPIRLTPARCNALAAWWQAAPDHLTLPELCAWLADTYDTAALAAAKFDDEPSRVMLQLAVERAEILRGVADLLEASDSIDHGDRVSNARLMAAGLRGGFVEHLKRVGRRELARSTWRRKRDALMSEAEQAEAKCPACNGRGRTLPGEPFSYNGVVRLTTVVTECDECNGTGKASPEQAELASGPSD